MNKVRTVFEAVGHRYFNFFLTVLHVQVLYVSNEIHNFETL